MMLSGLHEGHRCCVVVYLRAYGPGRAVVLSMILALGLT